MQSVSSAAAQNLHGVLADMQLVFCCFALGVLSGGMRLQGALDT